MKQSINAFSGFIVPPAVRKALIILVVIDVQGSKTASELSFKLQQNKQISKCSLNFCETFWDKFWSLKAISYPIYVKICKGVDKVYKLWMNLGKYKVWWWKELAIQNILVSYRIFLLYTQHDLFNVNIYVVFIRKLLNRYKRLKTIINTSLNIL